MAPSEEHKLLAPGQMQGSFLKEMALHLLVGAHYCRWGVSLTVWLLC